MGCIYDHLKETIYIPKIYVTYTYDVNPSIDLKNPSKKWPKTTPLLTRRQSCQWRAGSKGLIFGESNWLQRTLPSSPGPIAFCIVRSWNVSEAREDEQIEEETGGEGIGRMMYIYIYIHIYIYIYCTRNTRLEMLYIYNRHNIWWYPSETKTYFK